MSLSNPEILPPSSPKSPVSETNASDEDCPSKMSKRSASLECFPISTVEGARYIIENPPTWVDQVPDLVERSPTVIKNVISDCHSKESTYFPKERLERKLVPKTLVCHDYKGGYQEDKYFIAVPKGGCYTFYNWAHIDTFVYFSHHLITIPPFCWTKIAHQNGVRILGTFITEFEAGREMCDKLFKDRETMMNTADQLTEISKIFKFDGWLLNIENPIADTTLLKEFIEYLTKCIHETNPNGQVIWYDSVTEKGLLKWQNKLSPDNKCFFDLCDGIFLNYNWTEDHLVASRELAQHRHLDVYVGIDIFGRNTFYKQGFESYKAAKLIRKYNLSMAIFAPGWTQESLGSKKEGVDDDNTMLEKFLDRDYALWNALWPFLYTHPITKTFFTTFYCGTDKNFFDIFNQEQQLSKIKHPKAIDLPLSNESIPTLTNKCSCLQYSIVDKYTTCLITKEPLPPNENYIHHLFTCDINLRGNIIIFYHRKQHNGNEASLKFTLSTCNKNGSNRKIILHGEKKDKLRDDMTMLEVNPSEDATLIRNINSQYYYSWLSEGTWLLKKRLNPKKSQKMTCVLGTYFHNKIAFISSYRQLVFGANAFDLYSVYTFFVESCSILEIGASLENGDSIYLCSFGFYDHE